MNQAIRREGRGLSLPMEAQAAIAPFSVAIVLIVQHFLRLCPEIPKNSINIDKFPKINLAENHRKMFKNNDFNKNMSAGRSDKGPENFFAHRICPQIR